MNGNNAPMIVAIYLLIRERKRKFLSVIAFLFLSKLPCNCNLGLICTVIQYSQVCLLNL